MGALDGRVAIITGAGRGIGRAHALLFASEGARVVVNDLGVPPDGPGEAAGGPAAGAGPSAAASVVEEIRSAGGEAIVNTEDVADWAGGERLIGAALDAFGDIHVLVNNAGILRDRFLVNMSESEWDDIIRVHLKGHFVPLRHAAAYWRGRAKDGRPVNASVINTSSTSGLFGNPGQTNYGAAKAGIGALTVIAAAELGRYGVRVNAIAPAARTRLTEATPGLGQMVAAPEDSARFDEWDPDNVAPLAAWLATEDCPATGQVFYLFGGTIAPMTGWTKRAGLDQDRRWTVADIAAELPPLL
jgi:NAD(P)-dependent dehydrogenase (short-subunit alcohol dehydrogenase family)